MAIFEVQVRATNPRIGQIINIQLPGRLITPAEYSSWVDNDVEPDLSEINTRGFRLAAWRRKIREIRYFIDIAFDATVAAQARWADFDTDTARQAHRIQVVNDLRTRHQSRDTLNRAEGVDTNWGRMDRMRTGLVLADLPRGAVETFVRGYVDERYDPPQEEIAHRGFASFRILASSVPPAFLSRWQDPDDLVDLPRGMTPLTTADFERFPDNLLES